jgi:pyruvate/2-oxoglutarate/acetoin dehydrogenase E1 component
MRPILEIMFGDFLTLCADQLVNYVSKFRGMYDGTASCPMVLRTPMGGRRGYGPTHSQTLDRLLMGVPDLRLVAPSVLHDPGALLREAVADEAPVLFIENKLMYTRPVRSADSEGYLGPWRARRTPGPYPTITLSLVDFSAPMVTLATYGGMAEIVMDAAEALLIEHEVACEVVVPSLLNPTRFQGLEDSLSRSRGRLVTVEEGVGVAGWGAEVICSCSERGLLRGAAGRVAAPCAVIPTALPLESGVLPDAARVVREVLSRVG